MTKYLEKEVTKVLKGTGCVVTGFGPDSVAVMGDARFYGPCVFVRFPSGTTMERVAILSNKITNEVPGISRVMMEIAPQ